MMVSVIGASYVGLVAACCLAHSGHEDCPGAACKMIGYTEELTENQSSFNGNQDNS